MTVIAVCNQIGGSDNTTMAFNLAGAFAAEGKTVLLYEHEPKDSSPERGSIRPALSPTFEVAEMDRPLLLRQTRNCATGIRGHRHRLPDKIR